MTDPQRISAFSPITEAAATDSVVIVDVPNVPGGTKRIDAADLNKNLIITAQEIVAGVTPPNLLHEANNVLRFGAIGDGVADNTAAMNLAHSVGDTVYYPAGTYLFTNGVVIPSGGITGDGQSETVLKSNDTTSANLISYTGQFNSALDATANIPTFRDFTLLGNLSKTAGAGIQVSPAAGESSYLEFRAATFANLPTDIDFVKASLWKITGCNFLAYTVAGIKVANTNDPDSGDSAVEGGCIFNTPFTTGSGILQHSSGGLKVLGNKFLGGKHGYEMALNASANTGILIFVGNSVENTDDKGIVLARASGSATFTFVNISHNEIAGMVDAFSTDSNAFLFDVKFNDNFVALSSGTGNIGCNITAVDRFSVANNHFRGTGGTPVGVFVAASSSNGKIGINNYSALTTNVNNLDPSTTTDEGNLTEVVTATNVINASESGKTFYLNLAGGFTSTLPAPAAGLNYTFVVTTAPTTAYIITTTSSSNTLFGTFIDIVGELVYFSAQDTLNFVASASVIGDRLEVESDGANWYCVAKSGADGGITVAVT